MLKKDILLKRKDILMKLILRLISIATLLSLCLSIVPVSAKNEDYLKGVWVSTVYNLDYPSKATTSAQTLKKEADAILDNCEKMGMNAIILQVRPSGDALYDSDIYPWSKYLTGSQGLAPSDEFDPLKYWVKEAHKRGMELHAWLNPYRVTKGGDAEWNTLAPDNPAKMHPEWTVKYSDGNYYLNPGLPEVRQLVIDGALEIIKNYDVDGIHFDDYFYPGSNFNDTDTFNKYSNGFTNIDDWRRNNVDILIKGLNKAIKKIDSSVAFGVSPQGIWANKSTNSLGSATSGSQSYIGHYADTRKWVKEEYIDYICPQIYWYIGQPNADYKVVANWWADVVRGTDVELYIGMADYKADVKDISNPWYGITAIKKQIELNRATPEISGEMHFRYKFLVDSKNLYNYYVEVYNDSSDNNETIIPDNNTDTNIIKTSTADGQGKWCLFPNGSYKLELKNATFSTGWKKVDGDWYYFGSDAFMKTGWQKIDGTWFFFNGGGKMKTGWQKLNGSWYFFNNGGYMKTGWLIQNGKWYYLNSGGNMQTAWKKISNKWYYFYSNGEMAYDTITPDGYRLGVDGAML